MVKAVTLLLVFLAVLAVFGRLRFPGRKPKRLSATRCSSCGRPIIGNGPCTCGEHT